MPQTRSGHVILHTRTEHEFTYELIRLEPKQHYVINIVHVQGKEMPRRIRLGKLADLFEIEQAKDILDSVISFAGTAWQWGWNAGWNEANEILEPAEDDGDEPYRAGYEAGWFDCEEGREYTYGREEYDRAVQAWNDIKQLTDAY